RRIALPRIHGSRLALPLSSVEPGFLHRNFPSRLAPSMPLPPPREPAPSDLRERVVLITGANGGLGRALSLACARAGATVVLHGRVVRKLEALYDEIKRDGHPEPTILPLDLAKASADDFANVASALEAQLGRLDAIVHTAAMLGSL